MVGGFGPRIDDRRMRHRGLGTEIRFFGTSGRGGGASPGSGRGRFSVRRTRETRASLSPGRTPLWARRSARAGVDGGAAGDAGALPVERAAAELAGSISPVPRSHNGSHRVCEPVGTGIELAAMEPGGVADRLAASAARRGGRRVSRDGMNRIAARGVADGGGAVIDPRLFRLFRIAHVPAVAVVPGGVPPCESPGLFGRCRPAARSGHGQRGTRRRRLEAIAREGGPGRETARRHLAVLRGEAE